MAQKESVGGIQMDAELDVTKLDKGVAIIEGKLKKLDPALKKTEKGFQDAEKAANKAGGALNTLNTSVGKLITGIVGANVLQRAVVWMQQWGRSIIGASSNLTELTSKAQVVFGDSFPKLESQSRTVGQEVGRASTNILQFATDIGSVIKAFGIAGPLLDDMSIRLSRLAVDMASFHNATDEQAFMALRSGLTGETEPLKRFGIVLTDVNLQLFAQEKGLKQNVSAMNQAQKTALRYEFIMEKTSIAQGDAARTADSFANQTRRLQGEMQTFNEEAGRLATPILADGLGMLAKGFQTVRLFVRALTTDIGTLIDAMSRIPGAGLIGKAFDTVKGIVNATPFGALKQGSNALFGIVGQRLQGDLEAEKGMELGEKLDALQGFGGLGGASKADGQGASDLAEKVKKAEEDIVKAIGEQAKANLDNLNIRKKELEIRRDLGLITKKELMELERINNRVQFQESAVDEATKAWEKQKDVVEKVKDEIADITEEIADQEKALGKTLDAIDKRTSERKTERVAELVKERNEILLKGSGSQGISGDMSRRLGEIDDELRGVDTSSLAAGTDLAGLTEIQKIEKEGEKEKTEARLEAEESLVEMRSKLAEKTDELTQAEADLKLASEEVVTALDTLTTSTDANFTAIEERTKNHVDAQIIQLKKLKAAYQGVMGRGSEQAAAEKAAADISGVVGNYADGGMIRGPGTDRSDNLLAAVSPGERIISAATNRMYNPILEMIHNRTFPLPRFADGGVVNSHNNNAKNVNIEQHFHGEGARVMDESMIGYYVRRNMR